MEEQLIAYFSSFRKLSKEEEEAIKEDMEIQLYKKGTVLLKAGQKARDNYFVLQGCIRHYYLKSGEEKTTHFYTENEWILPAISHSDAQVSTYYLECTEECHLLIGNENKGNNLIKQYPKLQELSIRILEKEIIKQQGKMARYQNSTPEERYLALQQDQPYLLEKIPQYQLASYIGVKPESLSRIRKRLANSGKT